MKAIDLVWKAQPAIACLHTIAVSEGNAKSAASLREWLDEAGKLLKKRETRKGGEA